MGTPFLKGRSSLALCRYFPFRQRIANLRCVVCCISFYRRCSQLLPSFMFLRQTWIRWYVECRLLSLSILIYRNCLSSNVSGGARTSSCLFLVTGVILTVTLTLRPCIGIVYVEYLLSVCRCSSAPIRVRQMLNICIIVVLFTRAYAVWGGARYVSIALALVYAVSLMRRNHVRCPSLIITLGRCLGGLPIRYLV